MQNVENRIMMIYIDTASGDLETIPTALLSCRCKILLSFLADGVCTLSFFTTHGPSLETRGGGGGGGGGWCEGVV